MRRSLTCILICLVLGVVTTVAVAWGFALYERARGFIWGANALDYSIDDGVEWQVTRLDLAGIQHISSARYLWNASSSKEIPGGNPGSLLPPWCPYDEALPQFPKEAPRGEWRVAMAYGWPRPALWRDQCSWCDANGTMSGHMRGAWRINVVVTKEGGRDGFEMLPLIPIGSGFLIDTLFYGALWFGLIFGFGAARRGLRKKRGRCPMCKYDLRGDLDAGCPECGWNRAEAES